MNYFAITEPPSKKFVRLTLEKMGWGPEDFKKFSHHKHSGEDFLSISKKYPIFAVGDGVTLIQYLLEKKEYPNPSPAGEVAKIFCDSVIREAECRYKNFSENNTLEVFEYANGTVRKYNEKNGRTNDSVDYWWNDFYASTGAFVVIKENWVYWASICDSYVLHFDGNGMCKFKSPECNSFEEAAAPQYDRALNDPIAKAQYTWRYKRNGINAERKKVGYGVITGELNANLYLAKGGFKVESGDLILVITDGFEKYIEIPEFISILNKSNFSEEEFVKFTAGKVEEDPNKFGHERTIIAIRI